MTSPSWQQLLVAVVERLPSGAWTTYGDLATAVGAAGLGGKNVGDYFAVTDLSGAPAWRVLKAGGKLAEVGEWKWAPGHVHTGKTQKDVLILEGVSFNGDIAEASRKLGSLRLGMAVDSARAALGD